MDDVGVIYQTYKDGNIIDVNTFVAGIATQYGTYILKIENISQFSTFGENKLKPANISTIWDDYISYISTAMFSWGYNQKEATEYALLKAIEGSGLMLFEGNSNFSNWQAIKKNNNTVVNTDCNSIE